MGLFSYRQNEGESGMGGWHTLFWNDKTLTAARLDRLLNELNHSQLPVTEKAAATTTA
jgi:hypothetical protein